jgi:CheY-like chemotaxis protein
MIVKHSVLIIDDNPETRSLLRLMLRPIANQVWEASDGREGLRQAHQHLPDIIILDFMMPDMNGFEVCQRLRQGEKTADVPVILLTARQDRTVLQTGRLSGVDRCLFKPISRQVLLAAINDIFSYSSE